MDDDHLGLTKQLDENGWNTKGMIFPATLSRALMLASMIRDEILCLALGRQILDISSRVRLVICTCQRNSLQLIPRIEMFETAWKLRMLGFHRRCMRPLKTQYSRLEELWTFFVYANVQLTWLITVSRSNALTAQRGTSNGISMLPRIC